MNQNLLAWISNGKCSTPGEILSRSGQLAVNATDLAAGLRLFGQLGGITSDDVLERLRTIAEELAYIDALRDRLLRGAQRLCAAVERLARGFRGDKTHKDLLMQVRRLAEIGVTDLQARFDEVDLLASGVEEMVLRRDQTVALLRTHRDRLYVRCRAWEPFNMEWATIDAGQNSRTRHLANETYRFLAPRYMTVMEWRSTPEAGATPKSMSLGMDW